MNLRSWWLAALAISLSPPLYGAAVGGADAPGNFYVPADPAYSIVDSVQDSLRFTLQKTLKADSRGHLVSISSFVNPEAEVMGWHDFGNLEGPGWAANAVGGAWEIYRWGVFLNRPEMRSNALNCYESTAAGYLRAFGFKDG